MTADARLAEFPVIRRWPVAWGDQDTFAHVNNVVYFRWFESVRIAFFEEIGWTRGGHTGGVGPILASTSCSFKIPLTYPDTVILAAKAEDIGDDRFTMRYRIVSERLDRVAAEGEGRIVSFDYDAGKKAPLPPEIRAALLALSA
ncbi:acyl-CoA thioesterase [Nannocystis pusilla]|uniref:acyl-CoA thioesterase n=1 Tax=Nannocystis pusilla TaxID=889268 RepID=UPI003B7C428F